MNLEEMVHSYSQSTLKTIARFKGVNSDLKKEALAPLLAKTVVEKESIDRSLSQLDTLSREALNRIVLGGGLVSTKHLEEGLQEDGLVEAPGEDKASAYRHTRRAGLPHDQQSRRFEDVLARLTAHGLVFSKNSARGAFSTTKDFHPGLALVIPEEILRHIPRPALRLAEIDEEWLSDRFEIPIGSLHRDSQILASYVDRNEVVLTKQGLLPKRHWNAIGQSIFIEEDLKSIPGETGLGRPRFLRLALEQVGALAKQEDRLVCGAGIEEFLKQPRQARLRSIFNSWLDGKWWNEAERIPEIRSRYSRYDPLYGPQFMDARRFVVSLVRALPPGKWISIEAIQQAIRRINYDFLFPVRTTEEYERNNYYYGKTDRLYAFYEIYDNEKGWQKIEAQFIFNVIAESLFWLGLVALGHKGDEVVAVRINDLGHALLREESFEEAHSPSRKIVLQPNFQIFAFEPVDDHVLFLLEKVAAHVKTDSALEYRLTRESAYRAQQRGWPVQDILAYLEGVVDGEIPQNVQRTLLEWGEQHERIVFRRGISLCHTASAELLDSLLAEPELARYLGRRISDAAAFMVSVDSSTTLTNALLAKGHLPVLTTNDDGMADAAVMKVAPDGRVQFRQKVPSIYVLQRLSRFTDEKEGERWLTRKSIRTAKDNGVDLDEIVRILNIYHGSLAPPELLTRVRAWAGFFGKVRLGEVTLLKVADAATLKELLKDPRIGKLMKPLVLNEGLAVVQKQDVEVLRATLDELGIEVT